MSSRYRRRHGGRIHAPQGMVKLGGIIDYEQKLVNKRIVIVACGTSWHAGLVGEYLILQEYQ